ncbi:antithrombin-III [Phyllopteryx taeniolatus]|uniref:antithrombin-III n=1 Tax=Phyllopteryx taeniolatus TaxID=161469 RepID=UPI002AD57172|nr:antithrombin-III [Phyllopteryx taeniolatus]XP_061635471.1 antithrombin-III [Phyllopteryx taeniolatus]
MGSFDWLFLLSALSLASGAAPEDPCAIKAKDVAPQPRCVYRVPEGDAPDDATDDRAPRATNPRVWELSAANARFALSLYRQVALGRTPDTNLFLSPLGVSVAFSMTKLAACGRTLEEIVKVLELDSVSEKTSDRVHFYFARLLCRLRRRKDASDRLLVANRLFGDRSLRLDAAYQNISRHVYGADVMALDFRGEPEASRAAINAWVANETKNHIREALPAGAVGADAVLVLVNSIYFKGRWLNEFHRDNVYPARFHVDAGRSCSVRMMFQENKFRYARLPERRLQLLEMEYRGRDVALTLLLPDRGDTLAQVEAELDLPTLSAWLDKMAETTVSVHLPRFRLEESLRLKEALNALGLRRVFSPQNASLPGLLADGSEGVYISDAFHKAFLEVNELGSEASASSAAVASGRSIELDAQVFVADRPFLLLIRETALNAVLFVGRVARPCRP